MKPCPPPLAGTVSRSGSMLFLLLTLAAPVAMGQPQAVRDVADFYSAQSPTCGIQEAIDDLPPDGGVVTIPPGTYVLRRGLALRSRVTLRGSGATTVLTRGPQADATLTQTVKGSSRVIHVDSSDGFHPGDEVVVFAEEAHGWQAGHAVVKQVQSSRIVLEGPLHPGRTNLVYQAGKESVVVNYFAAIRGPSMFFGEPVQGITIRDLTIDGNLDENPGPWHDFTLSAIHLANASDALVRNVTVREWIADGIGVQSGRDNRVESCLVERCRFHGFHPGTSLRGAIFSGNIARENGGDGLYFCCIVTGITVNGNLFHGNKRSGIGGLGFGCGSSDSFNVVTNNVCRDNGHWGIEVTGGRNNLVSANVCIDNSRSQPGRYSGIGVIDSHGTLVSGNRCGSDSEEPTQRFGIEETGSSDGNVISNNLCQGNREGGVRIAGPDTTTSANSG